MMASCMKTPSTEENLDTNTAFDEISVLAFFHRVSCFLIFYESEDQCRPMTSRNGDVESLAPRMDETARPFHF